jgi:hypothetical protein
VCERERGRDGNTVCFVSLTRHSNMRSTSRERFREEGATATQARKAADRSSALEYEKRLEGRERERERERERDEESVRRRSPCKERVRSAQPAASRVRSIATGAIRSADRLGRVRGALPSPLLEADD